MQKIRVASVPLNEVIHEIADALGCTAYKKSGEQVLSIPRTRGDGTIKGINFYEGLGIIQYNCRFNEDTEIQFIVNEVHSLKFFYVIHGNLHYRFQNDKEVRTVCQFQNAIIASSTNDGHILSFRKDVQTTIFSLEIDREISKMIFSRHEDGMDSRLKRLFQHLKADRAFYYEGDYSLKMADIFKRIDAFEGSDFLYVLFLKSIAYQTLVEHISQYLDDQRKKKNRTVLRRSEIDSILMAVEYINGHLATYKSMPSLLKFTGLNAAKLQEGFKYFYNKTVHEYVYDARLTLAKDLLINTDDSISEIVYKIGLSSKSYFSRVFKQEYGVQPSSFRKTKRE